jgi:multicomponent Na+:H+ antiporter subunit E
LRKFTLTIFSFILWFLLVWPFDPVTRALDVQSIVVGAAVAVFVGLVFGDRLPAIGAGTFLRRLAWLIVYIPVFTWALVVANLDVAYRVIHPAMPIHPGIVKVKTRLKSREGRTMLANSITLTPGTMTVDITDDGYLYIHWINAKHEDVEGATRDIVEGFEKIIGRIFE